MRYGESLDGFTLSGHRIDLFASEIETLTFLPTLQLPYLTDDIVRDCYVSFQMEWKSTEGLRFLHSDYLMGDALQKMRFAFLGDYRFYENNVLSVRGIDTGFFMHFLRQDDMIECTGCLAPPESYEILRLTDPGYARQLVGASLPFSFTRQLDQWRPVADQLKKLLDKLSENVSNYTYP